MRLGLTSLEGSALVREGWEDARDVLRGTAVEHENAHREHGRFYSRREREDGGVMRSTSSPVPVREARLEVG